MILMSVHSPLETFLCSSSQGQATTLLLTLTIPKASTGFLLYSKQWARVTFLCCACGAVSVAAVIYIYFFPFLACEYLC